MRWPFDENLHLASQVDTVLDQFFQIFACLGELVQMRFDLRLQLRRQRLRCEQFEDLHAQQPVVRVGLVEVAKYACRHIEHIAVCRVRLAQVADRLIEVEQLLLFGGHVMALGVQRRLAERGRSPCRAVGRTRIHGGDHSTHRHVERAPLRLEQDAVAIGDSAVVEADQHDIAGFLQHVFHFARHFYARSKDQLRVRADLQACLIELSIGEVLQRSFKPLHQPDR